MIPDLVVLPPGTPKADSDYNDVEVIKPALVVEVASRSTETIDRGNKMIVYAKGDAIPTSTQTARSYGVTLHPVSDFAATFRKAATANSS